MHNRTRSRAPHRCVLSLAFAAGILFTCPPSSRAADAEIVAHRGGYLLAPENTLASFRSCAGRADRIEFDVRTSADGHLVVIHDETVNRTASNAGSISNVADLTLAQLKELDVGSTFSAAFAGERIPTLAEALQAMPAGMPVLVDRKTGSASEIVAALRAANACSNAAILCGSWDILFAARALEPSLSLVAGGSGPLPTNTLAMLTRNGVFSVSWTKADVSPEVVDRVHSFGMRIYVPVTTAPDAQTFLDMGADGLLADDPRLAQLIARGLPSPNAQLSRDLVAYWKFDDGLADPLATTAEDVETNSPGLLNSFNAPPAWLPGNAARMGGALQLDGIKNHVRIPSNGFLDIGTNAVTLSLWVMLDKLPSQITPTHACIYDSLIDSYCVYLDRQARELRFKVTDSQLDAARPGIPQSNLLTGVWHHVVGVYDGAASPAVGQALVYLDGHLMDAHVGSDASIPHTGLTHAVLPGQAASIGRNGSENNYYFPGAVDDVAIWRRALAPAEVRQIYQAGTNGVPLERSVMTLWIDNIYPDLQTGDMQLDLRVEHGSLTNEPLRLRGAADAQGTYVQCATLDGGRGKAPHFRIPHSLSSPGPAKIDAPPAFFQVVLP